MASKDNVATEKVLEKTLADKLNKVPGIWCIKLSAQFITGIPDRMVICRGGYVAFVEVKGTGLKPRRSQEVIHDKIRALGFDMFVLDNPEQRDRMIEYFKSKVKPIEQVAKVMSL